MTNSRPDIRDYYDAVLERGQLEMGGPCATAATDPAVKAGLLEFEIRPWYVAMKRGG